MLISYDTWYYHYIIIDVQKYTYVHTHVSNAKAACASDEDHFIAALRNELIWLQF